MRTSFDDKGVLASILYLYGTDMLITAFSRGDSHDQSTESFACSPDLPARKCVASTEDVVRRQSYEVSRNLNVLDGEEKGKSRGRTGPCPFSSQEDGRTYSLWCRVLRLG